MLKKLFTKNFEPYAQFRLHYSKHFNIYVESCPSHSKSWRWANIRDWWRRSVLLAMPDPRHLSKQVISSSSLNHIHRSKSHPSFAPFSNTYHGIIKHHGSLAHVHDATAIVISRNPHSDRSYKHVDVPIYCRHMLLGFCLKAQKRWSRFVYFPICPNVRGRHIIMITFRILSTLPLICPV